MKTPIWNTKGFRIFVGGSFLFIAFYIGLQYTTNFKSNKGIINTNTSTLVSPIAGFVVSDNLNVGDWVEPQQQLISVENRLQDYSYINQLRTEHNSLLKRVEALNIELEDHIKIKNNLEVRFETYLEWQKNSVNKRIQKLVEKRAALVQLYATADKIVDISSSLAKDKIVSQVEVYENTLERDRYYSDIESIDIELEELKVELNALENRTFLRAGGNDVPYSIQRLDTVELEIANLNSQIAEFKFRAEQIEGEITSQRLHLAQMYQYDLKSPVSGFIWRMYAEDGKHIDPTNELVIIANCETIFVDSIVSNRHANSIQVGEKIRVRFLGENDDFYGKVSAVYGASMKNVDRVQPAILPEVDGDEIIVRIRIDPNDLPDLKNNYCYIGRQVSVKFNRDITNSVGNFFGMLTSVF